MPEWLKDWWPVIGVVLPLALFAAGWAIRKGLVSRDDFAKGIGVESKVRAEALLALDMRVTASLAQLDRRTITIETQIQHLPTSEDIGELKDTLAGVKGLAEGTRREVEGMTRSLNRIEDHLMRGVSMSFTEATAASRRLALMRILVEMEGHANESVAETALKALGFRGRALGDGVRADLKFLEERGLVRTTFYLDRVMVGEITKRGVSYLDREAPPIDGIDYPRLGA